MSVMSDYNRRVNSIVVKNLPTDFDSKQLQDLFSQYGRISSSKVLPKTSSIEENCGFINYADADSCNQAVENMNNFVINGYTLKVSHSRTGFNGETNGRSAFSASVSLDENNGTLSPGIQTRFSSFRPASERPSKPMAINNNQHSNTNGLDTISNGNKPLWNSNSNQQQITSSISPINQQMNIEEHEVFIKNRIYNVYLSNLEVPNVVFVATLDDYVNATLLITQMNKHEQLSKVQANSYKSKLVVGQVCAALFNSDWYRARVLEIGDTRVRVQYIDWGNTGWCDSTLEIRPLPNEYFKDPALCVKCILDGVSSNEKLSDEQTKSILNILVLDLKLEMTVLRIENGISYIRLNLSERNLNNEIREILPSSTLIKPNQIINFDTNKPEINLFETHFVQLTTVDPQPECFHVLLMRDSLPTIMNVLKDWNANKQPLVNPPKISMLVCAQYEADDLWYRAWIEKITDKGYHVYFVDFGNEEIVSSDRLSECPDILRNIPWQSIQIKLANIKLTDDERYVLLRDFETERLEMKVIQKYQDTYSVDLLNNGKSLVEHILELRKKQPPTPIKPIATEVSPPKVSTTTTTTTNPTSDIVPKQTWNTEAKMFHPTTTNPASNTEPKLFQSTTTNPVLNAVTTQSSNTEQKNDSAINDNLTTLITEQRRQNRLLEQVIAAINTTNALLTQLVQR